MFFGLITFSQTFIEIILTFTYLQTYYKLQEFLKKGTGGPKWVNRLKWSLMGLSATFAVTFVFAEIEMIKEMANGSIDNDWFILVRTTVYLMNGVLIMVACIFTGAVIGVWKTLSAHKHLRKNEASMILKVTICLTNALLSILTVI